jgi:SAM-dependent methyltransferase
MSDQDAYAEVTEDTYDPTVQWVEWGERYERTYSPLGYTHQEKALEYALGDLDFETVLDVGCGFGRLGELIRRIRPGVTYSGIDVSPDQIAAAQRRIPDGRFTVTPILDFDAQGERWDLVVSAEVLMHQPDHLIEETVSRMFAWSRRHLVTCDFYDPDVQEWELNAWNRNHHYPGLYGARLQTLVKVDRQVIWVCRADNPDEES